MRSPERGNDGAAADSDMRRQDASGGQSERLVYERALPAVPLAVGRMRHELDAALVRLDVPHVRRHDVALVLTEAAANVVVHAYAGTTPGLLYTLVALSGRSLLIDVFDVGRGMVPNVDSPGLGVGLALMAQLTDGLDIVPNGGGGLRVTALFHGMPDAVPPAGRISHADRLREYAETLAEAHPDESRPEDAAAQALAQAQRLREERLG
jgi:anti-sigma regulatory factor (Ser/Thr protein kinase)